MTENEFKRLFKQSVKANGGFSASLSSNVQSGLPDLYCAIPSYGPVILEAKFLKEVTKKFNRTINYSALQKIFLQDCNKAIPGAAFGLIGFKLDGQLYAAVISHRMTKIDCNFRDYCGWSVLDKKTKTFDIHKIFDTVHRFQSASSLPSE